MIDETTNLPAVIVTQEVKPKKSGFNIASLLGGIIDGGMIKQVTKMLAGSLDKFASKMGPEECLWCVPSPDKTKLRIFRGSYIIGADKKVVMTITGAFDIGTIISTFDPAQLTAADQQKIADSL